MDQYPRSVAQRAASEFLKLPAELIKALRYEWDLWALPHQIAPDWDWATWLLFGGRGGGKNVGVTQYIRHAVTHEGVMRINFVGRTASSVRDDMVRGEAGIIAAFPPHQKPVYVSSQSVVRFHTGAEALMLTAEEPESIQGKNAEISWCDEFSTYDTKTEEVWTQVCLATRVGNPKKIITSNRLPDNEFLETLIAEAVERRIAVVQCSSWDNFANLPDEFQAQVEEMAKTAYGRAWVTGDRYQPEGALWKQDWIRYGAAPAGGLTVVAVDPAGTEDGDEHGIVVVRRVGDLGFVLDDLSQNCPVTEWPRIAIAAARKYGAARIVIERNRGLDYLAASIRIHDKTIPIKEIVSDISKADRAFPIAALYELGVKNGTGKIFHCARHEKLEKQMTTWDPKSQHVQRARRKAQSPNRIDALVQGVAELGFHLGVVDMSLGRAPRRDR